MKKQSLAFAAFMLAGITSTYAQNTNVGIGTVTPDVSARLDVFASNKGVLLPRVALQSPTDATTIATPATGLIVYNTNAAMAYKQGFYYNAGTTTAPVWTRMVGVDGSSTPVIGQTIVWNGNTYVTGSPAITLAPGTPLSGNGTTTNPLTINTASPVYNAGFIQGTTISNAAPAVGQVLVFNGTTYVPGNPAISTTGTTFTGNGTPGSPLSFNGVSVTSPVTGNGTTGSPLSVNTTLPIFNAGSLQGKTINNTAPTNGQVLVYNSTTGQYVPAPVNATQIQNTNVSNTTPTNGQVLIYNSTTNQYVPSPVPGDNWGTQTAATTGAAISGNGTTANPLMVNNTSPIFNANQINSKTVTGTPTTGQTLIYNGTSYVTGNPAISTTTNNFSGNGTPGSPLTFTGISTTGSPLSGNGTTTSPLSINTTLPVYNAGTIQGKTVSTTAPTTNQALIFNGTQYTPANVITGASNGLVVNGSTVQLGGPLTQNTVVNTGTQTLAISGTTNTTTFGTNGNVGIGATTNTTPSNALTINATNPLRLQGVQNGYGNLLTIDANGVVKQLAQTVTFHHSTCNTGSAHITQAAQTGPVPYTQGSSNNGSIPGGGSWTAIPGLTKTINIGDPTNDISFNCEGVTQYDGVLNTNSFVSYSIGIFIDGTLQATRSFTMVGAGSLAQFDTWQVSGQMTNVSAGNHTFSVYVARRNSNSAANEDLYFCGSVPTSTATNTNAFMNRGVLFINGSY